MAELAPVNVFDVANYILSKTGPITAMKLEKLVYFSHAWSLVWDETPLINNRIEAWSNGPVVPELFFKHQGMYIVSAKDIPGNPDNIAPQHKETIDIVINDYGSKPSYVLSELSHQQEPWINARAGLEPYEKCNKVISDGSIADYFSQLM